MRSALPWLGLGVRLVAAGIWLFAGAAKLADLTHFEAQVGQYDILPSSLETAFAYALPIVEVILGLYFLVGLLVRPSGGLSTFLITVFIAAEAHAWARGLSLDCGCFGSVAQQKVGPWTIVRDVGLGLPGLAMLIWPARKWSLDARFLGLPDRFAARRSVADVE